METSRIVKLVIVAAVVSVLATPAWAHQRYWSNASGLLVPYDHSHGERIVSEPRAEAKHFDVLRAPLHAVFGTFRLVGASFGKTLNLESSTTAPRPRRYTEFPNASGLIVRVPAY